MKNLVVLSGAGMSAESGISTFRDAGGLWDKYPVEQVATPEGYARNPELVINFYNERRKQLLDVKPNAGHIGLAELDKAGDGTQLRPFIVWFGESVPEIETAVDYVEKADIFVIIGTSMNVYPAAGLLNYVPRDAEVYLIDPKPVDVHSMRQIHVIQKGASEGVQELRSLLKP